MYWSLPQLEPEHRARLVALSSGGERPPAGAYFDSIYRPRLLVAVGFSAFLLALALALTARWLSLRGWFVWHPYVLDGIWAAAAFSAVYGLVCLAARIRTARCGIRPFVLITPAAILRVGLSHGGLLGFRLRDATKFNRANTYTNSQKFAGLAYQFVFPGDRFDLRIRSAAKQRQLDEVLATAKAGGAKGDEPLLPSGRGRSRTPFICSLLDPFSPLWTQTWVVIGLAACLGVIFYNSN